MDSDRDPFGLIEIRYGISIKLYTSDGPVIFDEVPASYPDTARDVAFEGVEGEGWVWPDGVEIYVAWRYGDNQTLLARLTYWGPRENLDEQVDRFHAVLEPALASIPELASTTSTRVVVPSPTSEAEDAATSTDD
ncbi:hypothetical protein CWT12_05960 [Actinomyces sp. 432]|nr:hypothetical protein CWT12_05960 [Actinomyces sp. 432]